MTVFKIDFIRKSSSNEPVILMGPMLLHTKAQTETFMGFLLHLKLALGKELKLSEIELRDDDIVFGSDQELALVNAINLTFPNSKLTLCSRHLSDYLGRFLDEKMRMNRSEIGTIKNKFFNLLLSSKSDSEFEKQSSLFINESSKGDETIENYLTKLVTILKKHLFKVPSSGQNWTNNNCESLNHVIKSFTGWDQIKPSALVKSLKSLHLCQINDIFRAFFGEGEYILKGEQSYASRMEWSQLSAEEIENKVVKFIGKWKKKERFSSTDGKLKLKLCAAIAKKPGQRTRPKVAKTRSKYNS